MSDVPSISAVAPSENAVATFSRSLASGGVVEIGLLVPAAWAAALIELSQKRQQTVGHLLRSAIEQTFIHGNLSS
jgi:hypothetical protein